VILVTLILNCKKVFRPRPILIYRLLSQCYQVHTRLHEYQPGTRWFDSSSNL